MSGRGPLPWLAAALLANLAAIATAVVLLSERVADRTALTAVGLVAAAGATVLFAVSWKIVDFLVMRRIRQMAAEVRAIAYGSAREGVDLTRYAIVSPLPEAVNEICERMIKARTELAEGLSVATRRSEENSARLAAILNDLHEGVVVCNLRHQMVLYNQVAFDMLRGSADLGLGRSLFETVSREPVLHMLDILAARPDAATRGVPFLAGTTDKRMLLQARMTLIRNPDGEPGGYVVTMVDAGPQVAALARRDALLAEVTEGLEETLNRLRNADSAAKVRREANIIYGAVKRVTDGYQRALGGWWPMIDLLSTDLFGFVAGRFEGAAPKVTATGLPVWLHGDSQSLVLAIESLVRALAAQTKVAEVDLAAGSAATSYAEEAAPSAADEIAWIDILWRGQPVADDVLAKWLRQPLPALGGMTVRDVLAHHAGPGVSQGRDGEWGSLRLPMLPRVEARTRPKAVLPGRPEFYDMDLLARDTGAVGSRPLKSLTFVVFDTETTGLEPSNGDQIVQIAGVRVVNGRILSGESFNRLVNPCRPIPPESIKFHGVTDDMVKDKPPAQVVLPQFHAFASEAVLVAHNAAFDLKFLKLKERECGLAFDNPVLDTMILSNYIDGPDAGHSLDAICERYAIEIVDRHTALGDAIVTAAVLLRQIEALESRGIHTLDEAVKACNLSMVLHERQRVL
ncbi:MAG: exonuclease domain-containing protein [Actinomycetota bacterium]